MNIALLTAGGVGNRMGQDIPKQFMTIDNIPVIIYTMQAFQSHPQIDAICVVCLKGWEVVLQAYANQFNITKLKWIFEGGDSNQHSIRNGLWGLRDAGCAEDDIILVHDGVRPLVAERIITENIDIPRERLVRTQTPHTYALGTLLKAHAEADAKGIDGTVASCTLMAELGVDNQHLVMGSEKNGLKLTQTEDVELFKALKHTTKDEWLK